MIFSTPHVLETAEMLLRYRRAEFLCDTSLIASDQQFKAHSVVLASVSPVFRAAFASSANASGMYQVDLSNIKPHALETALDFIYTGQLIVPTPEHATKEQLAILLSTLQVLGLDMNKLDGCEIKFKSEIKKPNDGTCIITALTGPTRKPVFVNQLNIKEEPKTETLHMPTKVNQCSAATVTPVSLYDSEEIIRQCISSEATQPRNVSADNETSADESDNAVDEACSVDPHEEALDAEAGSDAEEGSELEGKGGTGSNCVLVEREGSKSGKSKYYVMLTPKEGEAVDKKTHKQKSTASSGLSSTTENLTPWILNDESFSEDRTSTPQTSHSFLCDTCGMVLATKFALDLHVRVKHPNGQVKVRRPPTVQLAEDSPVRANRSLNASSVNKSTLSQDTPPRTSSVSRKVSKAKSSSGMDSASEAESELDDWPRNKSTKVNRRARKSVVPSTSGVDSETDVGEYSKPDRSTRQAIKRPSRYSSGLNYESDNEDSRIQETNKKFTCVSQPTYASGEDSDTAVEGRHLTAKKTRILSEHSDTQVLNNTTGLDTSG